jgi:predicted Rossmann fold nucleotide-binding protein DprA/Smf involved in DNA uptake
MLLDRVGLIDLIDSGQAANASITPVPEENPISKSAPARGTRALRGSKVNDTVRAALADGPRTVKQLKTALEEGGFAPGSLSTALMALQKSGEIGRTAEGIYQLAQAAE